MPASPEAVERFRREVAAIGALNHENIVQAHDACEVSGAHFLVMEFSAGVDVRRLLKEVGSLPCQDAAEIARQAAAGLAAIHEVDNLAPLRTGDYVRFSIRLRQPAYVRLLGIDAAGEPLELYPLDPEAGQQGVHPVTLVQSSLQFNRGWPLEGNGGIETALLPVSRTSLQHLTPAEFRTGLPTGTSVETVQRFVAARSQRGSVQKSADGDRSLGPPHARWMMPCCNYWSGCGSTPTSCKR